MFVWCCAGTRELIFTPKFITSRQQNNTHGHASSVVQPPLFCGRSAPQSLELQHYECSSAGSLATSADAALSISSSCGNNFPGSSAAKAQCGFSDASNVADRCCGGQGSGAFAPGTPRSVCTSHNNTAASMAFKHGALRAKALAALQVDGTMPYGRVNACGVTLDQCMLPQQQWQPCDTTRRSQQSCLQQQHQLGGHATVWDEAGSAAGSSSGAYLPTFKPLGSTRGLQHNDRPAAAMLASIAARAASQPTSLPLLAAGQQAQLCMPPALFGGLTRLASCSGVSPFDVTLDHSIFAPAAFGMLPGSPTAVDSSGTQLPMLPPGFGNSGCFSNYSNFLEGCAAMPLGQADMSGMLSAAADCSAGLLASGASLGTRQQQQLQQQHLHALQSGSNLQLTTGALFSGSCRDDLDTLQQQQLLQWDGFYDGFFDMNKSGSSSVASIKDDDATTAPSSSSTTSCYPNKQLSCGNSDTRHVSSTLTSATAVAWQQHNQLSTMQEQHHVRSFTGTGQQGQEGNQLLSGSCLALPGTGMRGTGPVLATHSNTSTIEGEDGVVTFELPVPADAVAAVAEHITSITELTGAVVVIAASAGQLTFKLLGRPQQVQFGINVIQMLLQHHPSKN